MSILAVDPGIDRCGVALLDEDGTVTWAALVSVPRGTKAPEGIYARAAVMADEVWHTAVLPLMQLHALVIECSQVYRAGKGKGDPNDLIPLAAVGGALAVLGRRHGVPNIVTVAPATWKGQVPKDVMCARIEASLSDSERGLVAGVARSYRHNVLDAIGIGRWFVSSCKV